MTSNFIPVIQETLHTKHTSYIYDNRQLYHAQHFYSINFHLLWWSQWCLSSHQNYDKSCAANTAQPASLHLTVRALNKYFCQIQYIIQKTCTSNNCGRLAVTHAKHNAKTSSTNTVSHITTNDKYQITSEQHRQKTAALRLLTLLFPSFETPLHFSLIMCTHVQYCNFCSKYGSDIAIMCMK